MNYPFKDKFSATPQHDSEGFTMMDARCVGCGPEDMCPRSGHCERYESPIRETHGIPAWMISSLEERSDVPAEVKKVVGQYFFGGDYAADLAERRQMVQDADYNLRQDAEVETAMRVAGVNPEGWQEVDGVLLPHIAWGEPQ